MKATTVRKKCQACNGNMSFDPASKTLVCQQCGASLSILGGRSTFDKSFRALLANAPTWQKDTAVYCCHQCGAKSVITKHDLIVECKYCGAKNVNKTKELPGVRPDTVVTFDLTQQSAKNQIHRWLAKRIFIPNEFRSALEKQPLNGIYFPAFTFDVDVMTKYNGIEVQSRTISATIDGKTYEQSHKFRRQISGIDNQRFDDLLVLTNEEITPQVFNMLQPFDLVQGQAFNYDYLTGFTVSQSSKDPNEAWEEAKGIMEQAVRKKIAQKYKGSAVEDLQTEMGIVNVTYKYALLPIYTSHAEHKGNRYQIYVNGQTGKVYGKTPKSGWKILSFFASLGAIAVGLGIVLAMFL